MESFAYLIQRSCIDKKKINTLEFFNPLFLFQGRFRFITVT